MTRQDEKTATKTAATQNAGYYDNAQNSYTNAQTDAASFEKQLGTYGTQVGAFSSANPYGQGGTFQTTTNQQLTDTADASARALGTTLQGQALRTGQNTAGGVAAAEQAQEQNERTLSGQEADATQKRIAAGAAYGKEALDAQGNLLSATAVPVSQQTTLAGQQANAAEGALGNQVKAGETPSWTDEFGNSVATGLGQLLTGNSKSACWIAAELYGGWSEPRTVLVRGWLFGEFRKSLFGRVVTDLYLRFGEGIAAQIHKHPPLQCVFLPIFNLALRKAQGGR
jgi:hypothetical protein